MEFVKTFSKAWKIPEIRSKIIFTLLMLLVFRIGSNIPVPGIDREYLRTSRSLRPVLGWCIQQLYNICSEYHPIHYCIDYCSVTDDRIPVL